MVLSHPANFPCPHTYGPHKNVDEKTNTTDFQLPNHDHLVAEFVYFNEGKVNSLGREQSHLVLQFVAVRRTFWVSVVAVTNVASVPWCISDVEDRLDGAWLPAHAKRFVEAALDVFWHVVAS